MLWSINFRGSVQGLSVLGHLRFEKKCYASGDFNRSKRCKISPALPICFYCMLNFQSYHGKPV